MVLFTGCASVVTGTKQKVTFNSTPPGAKVLVTDWNGMAVVETNTPAVVKLKRGKGYFSGAEYKVSVELNGYQPAQLNLQPNMNGWYAGNVLFGGLIGLVFLDPATGAMWAFDPYEFNLVLKPETVPKPTPDTSGKQ